MTGPEKIDVGQYAHELSQDVGRFFDYWLRQHEVDPETYPDRMARGEWDEQFQAWGELQQGFPIRIKHQVRLDGHG